MTYVEREMSLVDRALELMKENNQLQGEVSELRKLLYGAECRIADLEQVCRLDQEQIRRLIHERAG